MLRISDGNPEIGAHIRRNLCHLICLRHLDLEQSQKDFFVREVLFSFMHAQHVLSYHLISVPWISKCKYNLMHHKNKQMIIKVEVYWLLFITRTSFVLWSVKVSSLTLSSMGQVSSLTLSSMGRVASSTLSSMGRVASSTLFSMGRVASLTLFSMGRVVNPLHFGSRR